MNTEKFIRAINGEVVNTDNAYNDDLLKENAYCGDLLSDVLANAPEKCVWFTILTNINVCAVAVIKKMKLIVICGGNKPDNEFVKTTKANGLNVVLTELGSYDAVKKYISESI